MRRSASKRLTLVGWLIGTVAIVTFLARTAPWVIQRADASAWVQAWGEVIGGLVGFGVVAWQLVQEREWAFLDAKVEQVQIRMSRLRQYLREAVATRTVVGMPLDLIESLEAGVAIASRIDSYLHRQGLNPQPPTDRELHALFFEAKALGTDPKYQHFAEKSDAHVHLETLLAKFEALMTFLENVSSIVAGFAIPGIRRKRGRIEDTYIEFQKKWRLIENASAEFQNEKRPIADAYADFQKKVSMKEPTK